MSAEKDWLTLLDKATSYGDLQRAFDLMRIESQSAGNGDSMAESIDEAIRRIELERARDQAELDGFSSQYDSFKQEQSGVIGWFKRKLPFTETRKQELGHRDAVNDQSAEILADNFVIARAQMLKERVVSPTLRRMGQHPSCWRSQLLSNDSVGNIKEYGSVVHAMGQELKVAKLFVDSVSSDIEAFASAKFVNKEDQQRRNEDLIAARGELKDLVDESQDKAILRTSGLATLKRLLISELSENDIDFRDTVHRLALVKSLQEKHPKVAKLIEDRLATVKTIIATLVEIESIPTRREKVEKELSILKRDLEAAEERRSRAVCELEGPSQLFQAALSESQQAKAALNATKPLYDAYISEQNRATSNAAEVTSESDFDILSSDSRVVSEYRKLDEVATKSAQTLSQRTQVYEQAKLAHDNAVREANAIRDKSDAQILERKKIADQESELQQQVLKATQSIESTFPELRASTASYLEDAVKITWSDSLRDSVRSIQEFFQKNSSHGISQLPFSVGGPFANSNSTKGLADRKRDSEQLVNVIQALESNRKVCLYELTSLSKSRREALQRRGQMLLEHGICSELDFD